MLQIKAPETWRKLTLYLIGASMFLVGIAATAYVKSKTLSENGFDFSLRQKQKWSGPDIGERLNLAKFVSQNKSKLSDSFSNELAMLIVVATECAASRAARDEMQLVCSQVLSQGIPCKLVSFTDAQRTNDLVKLTNSLNLNADTFTWEDDTHKVPEKLLNMVVPSFLLIDQSGIIVAKWPGTDQRKSVRNRMAAQIVSDTNQILHQ